MPLNRSRGDTYASQAEPPHLSLAFFLCATGLHVLYQAHERNPLGTMNVTRDIQGELGIPVRVIE